MLRPFTIYACFDYEQFQSSLVAILENLKKEAVFAFVLGQAVRFYFDRAVNYVKNFAL